MDDLVERLRAARRRRRVVRVRRRRRGAEAEAAAAGRMVADAARRVRLAHPAPPMDAEERAKARAGDGGEAGALYLWRVLTTV